MKRTIFATVLFPLLVVMALAASSLPAAGLETDKSPVETRPAQPVAPDMPASMESGPVERRPVEELSSGALETYAYLLFIQAILDEDEAALIDVTPLLAKSDVAASIWLDGGVWLVGRNSANAIPYLEQALKSLPDNLSLNLLYAEALGDHGMAGRGVDLMREYLRKYPHELDARLELALLLVKDKKFDEAQKILAQITAKQRTPLVDYYQAKALIGMERRSEAIPYLRKAIKGMPDFVEALSELAFLYEQEGNWREARSMYEKLRKLNFSPQDVSLRLVNLSLKLRQPEKAVQYVRQGPDSLAFRLTAANMFLEARHYLQAENILKRIADKGGAPAEVYLLLADVVYEQRHNLKMAFAWLDKIPRDSPGAGRGQLLRLQLLAEAGQLKQALEESAKGMKEFPDMPEFCDFRIRLLAKEKKMPEALALAREGVKKWPANPTLNFLLGSILDETGEKKEALRVMEDLVKQDPENYQALNYVGFTLAEQNRDLDRALELLSKANGLSPDQAYIVDSLAWALFKSGKGQEALREIRRAVNLGETADPAIWEHYGDIAASQGRKDEARKAYRRAIEMKPANAAEIRGKISKL